MADYGTEQNLRLAQQMLKQQGEINALRAELETARDERDAARLVSKGRTMEQYDQEAELGRLRNRITALEANGSELLARAERAEAELAEIKRVTDPPEIDEEMPADPAELREMWEFINRQFRWWHHMAQTFSRGRRRAIGRTEQAEAVVERVRDLCHQPYTAAYDLAADVLAELPCRPGNAPESNTDAPTPVSAATEAHGGAGGA